MGLKVDNFPFDCEPNDGVSLTSCAHPVEPTTINELVDFFEAVEPYDEVNITLTMQEVGEIRKALHLLKTVKSV